jgi:ABC-type uncharacterized transport system involved in gliding motility auxiliary subunit
MSKKSAFLSIFLVAILFAALVVVNNQWLSQFRIDLTEDNVYSLSSGSIEVMQNLDEPITLYFFFSDSTSKGMTSIRNYANRVQSLLEEYEKQSEGKIRLQIIDPEPFSEAEDQASQFGLTGATIGPIGDAVYLGLAGTNALDDQFTIGFFDPQRERFLEYEISKLIYQLSDPEPVKLTLLTDLAVAGGPNPITGQYNPAMTFYTQLNQLYDVQVIGSDAVSLPADTDVLMVVHPQELSEQLNYAIDQYVMGQGKLIVFVDPLYESDPMSMMGAPQSSSSAFPLLAKWGILVDTDEIILDAQLGMDIRSAQGGVVRHPGILGVSREQLNRNDVITANLEMINGASFGAIHLKQTSRLRLTPLAYSSVNSYVIPKQDYAQTQQPQTLLSDLPDSASSKSQTLAARITGPMTSAFDGPIEEDNQDFNPQTSSMNLIVVADVDLLADRFWVQQSNFFGQTIYTPFANNGDFVTNSSENMAGSDALISIRSRGTYARPFTRVQDLEVAAEAKYREQEERLQQQLAQTEQQLTLLQEQQGESGALALSPQQQQAVDEFIAQRVSIRKALRDVRYQLERDIDTLGNYLKILNIAVAPFFLVLILWIFARLFKRRAGKSLSKEAE